MKKQQVLEACISQEAQNSGERDLGEIEAEPHSNPPRIKLVLFLNQEKDRSRLRELLLHEMEDVDNKFLIYMLHSYSFMLVFLCLGFVYGH